ncbi:MAG: hypothetical protein ACXVLQ_06915 [Bacteriovorax sp.]
MKRKLFIYLTFIIGILSTHEFAWAGGDLVNNGGGLAERNVLFAYNNLEFSLRLCVDAPTCRLSSSEHNLLKEIYDHLSEERANLAQIKFISEKKYPGTFIIDGEMKAAVTGSTIGSEIRINTDLLYTEKTKNEWEALSVHEAIAMLVHELGHHYGSFTHTELDLLGLKVSEHLNKSTYQTPLLPNGSPVSAVFINGDAGTSFPEVLLYGYQQMFNLSDLLKKEVGCQMLGLPIRIGPIPPIQFPIHKPKAFQVNNVYWSEIPRSNKGRFKIKGSLTNYCDNQVLDLKLNRDYKFEISFTINRTNVKDLSNWVIDEKSIKINQIQEPWIRILEVNPF